MIITPALLHTETIHQVPKTREAAKIALPLSVPNRSRKPPKMKDIIRYGIPKYNIKNTRDPRIITSKLNSLFGGVGEGFDVVIIIVILGKQIKFTQPCQVNLEVDQYLAIDKIHC